MIEALKKSMYDLIVETSTKLPKDVRRAIAAAKAKKMRARVQQCHLQQSQTTLKWRMKTSHQSVRIRGCRHLKLKLQLV